MKRPNRGAVVFVSLLGGASGCHAETTEKPTQPHAAEDLAEDLREGEEQPGWAALFGRRPSFTPPAALVLDADRIPAPPSPRERPETGGASSFDTGPGTSDTRDGNPWVDLEDGAACKVEVRPEQGSASVDSYWIRRVTAGVEYVGWVDSKGELSGQVRHVRDAHGRVVEKEIHRREASSKCLWERERELYRYDEHGALSVAFGEHVDREHPFDRFSFLDQFVTTRDDSGRPLRTYTFQSEVLWGIIEYIWADDRVAAVTTYDRHGAWESERRFTWHGEYLRIDRFEAEADATWRHRGWAVYERLGHRDYRKLAASSDAQLERPQQTWTYESTDHGEVVTERRAGVVVSRTTYEYVDGVRRLASREGQRDDTLVELERWDWSVEPVIRRTPSSVEAHYHECTRGVDAEIERAARSCRPPKFGAPAVELREDDECPSCDGDDDGSFWSRVQE